MKNVWLTLGSFVLGALIGCAEPDPTNTEAITPGASAPDGAFETGTDVPSDNLAPQDGADVPVDSDPDVTMIEDGDVVLPLDGDADDAALDGDDATADRPDAPTPDVPTDGDAATSPDADVTPAPDADASGDRSDGSDAEDESVLADRPDVPTPDVPTDGDAATTPDADVPTAPDADASVDVPVDMPCPSGLTRCGASCVDIQGDSLNCGRCGTVCATNANAAPTCGAGACANACRPGFGDCDGNVANGCEANLNTAAAHCGRCGLLCRSGICNGSGVCEPEVNPVFELVYMRGEIVGIRLRIVSGRFPNYRGAFVDNPCLPPITSGRRSCRIDLRRLQIPDVEVPTRLFTSTTDWRGGYGFEGIPLGADGNSVCSGADCRLPSGFSCGAGTSFSCITVLCNAGTAPMNTGLLRYEEMYGGAGRGFRGAASDSGALVCSAM